MRNIEVFFAVFLCFFVLQLAWVVTVLITTKAEFRTVAWTLAALAWLLLWPAIALVMHAIE